MKKILLTLAGFMIALLGIAQSPNLMNYQGVARNATGNVLPNQPVALRLTILSGSTTGPAVYSETRNVTTNAFGLFNVVVGSPGAITSTGTIAGINWTAFGAGSGSKFLQVEIDPTGGTNFVNVGSTQLVSVPYALNAAGAAPVGPAGGDLTGTYPNPLIAPLAVTTPKIADGAVTSVKVTVPLIKVQADAGALIDMTNSGAGPGVSGINTGTGFGGLFSVNNPASVADGIRATTNGTGASWAIRAISSGTNGAALLQQTNTTNTANNLQSNQAGLGRAGLFNSTNAASTANAVDINIAGTGYALRAASTNAVPLALQTVGGLQHTGIGEALNFVLRSDAAGTATWVDPATLLPGANFWSRVGTNLFNTNLGDNVGVGTNAPTHKFTVSHGGSTGISVSSTAGFSVVDINAASGDAALRFGNAGVNQWNMRNRPGDNYLEWFELGGGGSRMVIQDATGNVGIGETNNPTYKLDVLHGGSTGIRSRSSASFSVVDIDAFSGDAALRFANNGVNQWNMRNRPGDNYLEWFELGGGGSRMVIQDATGNVGIGETTNPTYKLDVLHGGSTGIRSRSSASFSVVDIDAFSGDAALRFIRAGVNKWNTRNEPVNDDYQWFELGGGGERMRIQRGSGNVGINQPVPAYRLDVNHGGATGVRVQSSASFSVVDIDAFSGDAALRFIRAGVNKWNTRNEPVNDDYQWFELGGGGERMRIQRGSGNVGINQPVPAYRLDVNHGGSTGIRVQSSASFSVVDIDGFSGDAALRFIRAGVNKWNTRNEPVFDDYQIFELGGGGERMRIKRGTGFVGINTSAPSTELDVVGTITGTVKNFTIDHPLDPANKTLRHTSIESPDALDVYSGNIVTDASGKAVVILPSYFEALNKDFRYQLTIVGGTFAQAMISKEIVNNRFEIATNQPNIKVSWQVQGVRNDAYMKNVYNLKVEEDKPASIKGKYYHPEAYGLPKSMGVNSNSDTKGTSTENVQISPAKIAKAELINGSSLENIKVAPSTNKVVDKSGSVEDIKLLPKVENKKVDNSGSVAPEVKKEEKKPVVKPAEKGSTEQ